jgi:hypothetical protein
MHNKASKRTLFWQHLAAHRHDIGIFLCGMNNATRAKDIDTATTYADPSAYLVGIAMRADRSFR